MDQTVTPPAKLAPLVEAVAGLGEAVTKLEETAAAPVVPQVFELKYANGHPKAAEGLPKPLRPPYALCFDTVGMSVQDYHEFSAETPLVAVKAVFVNVIQSFAAEYRTQAFSLFSAGQAVAKSLGKDKPIIPHEMFDQALGLAQMAVDRARERVLMWDGKGEFHAMLPYAVVVEQEAGGKKIIDFQKSRLSVNGMIWTLKVVA